MTFEMTRRGAIAGLGLVVVTAGLVLNGCASGSFTPAQAAADLSTLATGLSGAWKQINALPNMVVPVAVDTAVTNAFSALSKASSDLAASLTQTSAQSAVLQAEGAVNTIVADLSALPGIPPNIQLIFQAASVLLPVIETAVGFIVPAKAGSMTPEDARMVLLSVKA